MRSTVGLDVAAPAELVFRLARDVERWPELLPHYARARRLRVESGGALVVEFVARRQVLPWIGLAIPVTWRSRTWSDPATLRLRFAHLGGATAGMDVTWRIAPTPGGCHVEIEHRFRRTLPVPVLGQLIGPDVFPRFVDRFFTRPIAGRTLATFRALAEALRDDDLQSARTIPTNTVR
ncbi:MAG TPA: SRPBCC family protein [Candidatus Saccharimonadales bacterium]|nr:SRPBCC family protein [Candidatus Saccharimonadales bacterium]